MGGTAAHRGVGRHALIAKHISTAITHKRGDSVITDNKHAWNNHAARYFEKGKMPKKRLHEYAIFIDNGNVLSDNARTEPQWIRLTGQYFSTRFGGSAEKWGSANQHAFTIFLDRYRAEAWGRPEMDYNAFQERELAQWIVCMFERVGLDPPPLEDRLDIMLSAYEWITERVRASIPGAVEAVHELNELGCHLYTCSGASSTILRGYLRAMGVEKVFRSYYGPDLVNCPKEGPLFFWRLFEDSGVQTSKAVVVDDMPMVLKWAEECGAICIQVGDSDQDSGRFTTISGLSELPELLTSPQ